MDSIDGARSGSGALHAGKHRQPWRERQSWIVGRRGGAVVRRGDDRELQRPRPDQRRAGKAGHRRGRRWVVEDRQRSLLWDEPGLAARRRNGGPGAPAVSRLWSCGCGAVSEESGDPATGERRGNAGSAQQRVGLRVRLPSASATDPNGIPTGVHRHRLWRPVWNIVCDKRGRKHDRGRIAERRHRRGAVRRRLRVYRDHGRLFTEWQADCIRRRGRRLPRQLGIHQRRRKRHRSRSPGRRERRRLRLCIHRAVRRVGIGGWGGQANCIRRRGRRRLWQIGIHQWRRKHDHRRSAQQRRRRSS